MKTYLWMLGLASDHAVLWLNRVTPDDYILKLIDYESINTVYKTLHEDYEQIMESEHIIIPCDDEFPIKVKNEIIRRLNIERCYRVDFGSEEFSTLDDVYGEWENDDIIKAIFDAEPYPVEGIITVKDVWSDLVDAYQDKKETAFTTGWLDVDRHYTVPLGQFTVVTGIPSHGKSEWLDGLCVNLAVKHGFKTAFYSPENYPVTSHIVKHIRKHAGKPFGVGYNGTMSIEKAKESAKFFNDKFYYLHSTEIEYTIDKILDLCRVAIIRHGINGLVIDPWNEVEHIRPSGMTETEYISQVLTKIRKFARHYNIHVWIVAHPRILRKEDQKKPPTPYDISGSANWFNKPDFCVTVFRPDQMDDNLPTEVYIWKVRFRDFGKPGDVKLRYNKSSGEYYHV